MDETAAMDPSATTIRPGAEWVSGGDFRDITYELSEGDIVTSVAGASTEPSESTRA